MVDFKNNNIKYFLQASFNKGVDSITDDDLRKVEVVPFEGDRNNPGSIIDLSDISYFPNVRKVVISDSTVNLSAIDKLKEANVKELRLNRSALENDEDLSELTGLESLELISSYNDSYDFLSKYPQLKFLAIVNPYTEVPISLKNLENSSLLEALTLQRCILDDFSLLSSFSNVSYLNIIAADIPNNYIEILNGMEKLKTLFISERHNTDGLKSGVTVKHNFYDMLFDIDEEVEQDVPKSIK